MGSVLYQIQHTGLTFQPLTRIVVIPRPCRDSPVPETPTRAHPDKRRSRRAKITRPLRVRPSDPRDDHFEDLPVSVNASKEGIFFTTRRNSYYKGITTFRHFPFQFATRSDELRICGRGRSCGGVSQRQVWRGRELEDDDELQRAKISSVRKARIPAPIFHPGVDRRGNFIYF